MILFWVAVSFIGYALSSIIPPILIFTLVFLLYIYLSEE